MKSLDEMLRAVSGTDRIISRRNLTLLLYSLVTIPALISLFASGAIYAKNYTRSCSAKILISASTPTGERLQGAQFDFTGKGVVGYYAPNKARERARRKIDRCLDAAWQRRYGTSTPPACTESSRIYNYPFTGLHFGIQQAVCLANRGHDEIMVDVNTQFSGKRGCLLYHNVWGGNITRGYRILCPTGDDVLH